jgi:hypothetical protein
MELKLVYHQKQSREQVLVCSVDGLSVVAPVTVRFADGMHSLRRRTLVCNGRV